MIDHRELIVNEFGRLAIAIYRGRLLAISVSTGPQDDDSVVLFACDRVDANSKVICTNEELHRLCVSR